MGDFGKIASRDNPYPDRRAIGAYQAGKDSFHLPVQANKRVIFCIADFRLCLLVCGMIAGIMIGDYFGQLLQQL